MNKREGSKAQVEDVRIELVAEIGNYVRYYSEGKGSGWKLGQIVDVKPRKKQIQIKPSGNKRAFWAHTASVEGVKI